METQTEIYDPNVELGLSPEGTFYFRHIENNEYRVSFGKLSLTVQIEPETTGDQILAQIMSIAYGSGFRACQKNIRDTLGIV